MSKHKPTPWTLVEINKEYLSSNPYTGEPIEKTDRFYGIESVGDPENGNSEVLAADSTLNEADAKRIIACVNACDGINPDAVKELKEAVRWVAQTVHQAHHLDQAGTFRECPKNTCKYAADILSKVEKK